MCDGISNQNVSKISTTFNKFVSANLSKYLKIYNEWLLEFISLSEHLEFGKLGITILGSRKRHTSIVSVVSCNLQYRYIGK